MSCPDCFKGALHSGKPTGIVTVLHGLDVYVAEPASGQSPKGFIVLIPDAFGWDFVNIQLMADNFARKQDYRVYVPDFMNGELHAILHSLRTIGLEIVIPNAFPRLTVDYRPFGATVHH